MKNYFKYSILMTLILVITIGLAHGAIIGTGSNQVNPYESLPTMETYFMVGGPSSSGIGSMKDGDLGTSGLFTMGAPHLIRPNGDGFYKAWTTGPTTGLGYFAWKEETSDGDGSYYTNPATSASKVTSTLQDPPADASGSITAVKVTIVARRTTSGSVQPMLYLGTSFQLGTTITLTGSYATYTQTIARPGGGTWSWADIASLEAGVNLPAATTAGYVRVTQLYVTVEGPTSAYFELNMFGISPAPLTIGFVDLKMKYNVPAPTTDDSYAIQYAVGESAFTDLQPAVSGDKSKYDPAAVRSFSQIADPIDGVWDWADISVLRLRITITQAGGAWDGVSFTIFDAWATIYTGPLPPTGSTGVSVQPPMVSVATGQEFFVDIYVQNVVDNLNWEFTVDFDGTIITPTSYFEYWPWTVEVTADLSPDHVYIASGMPLPVPIGQAFAGNSPIARIYFTAIKGGTTGLTLRKGAAELILGDTTGAAIPRAIFDGRFSSAMILSAVDATDKPILITDFTAPISTNWHEIYPEPSHKFHLTGWTDNGDTVLSASDQIELTDEAGAPRFFHVDVVTITIHYTFKDPDTGAVAAEPESPTTEMPPGDPTGTRWIEIFPTYGRAFTITSWIDQGTVAGTFDPSDQFDFTYDDTPETTHWAHLDNVSTDIQVSEKAVIPEFPVFAIMPIALVFAVAYLWLKRRDKTPIKLYAKIGGALK